MIRLVKVCLTDGKLVSPHGSGTGTPGMGRVAEEVQGAPSALSISQNCRLPRGNVTGFLQGQLCAGQSGERRGLEKPVNHSASVYEGPSLCAVGLPANTDRPD